jgi:hypothetical protein
MLSAACLGRETNLANNSIESLVLVANRLLAPWWRNSQARAACASNHP